MRQPIDHALLCEVLQDVQPRIAGLESMRSEMRHGFAALRVHMATQHGSGSPVRGVRPLHRAR